MLTYLLRARDSCSTEREDVIDEGRAVVVVRRRKSFATIGHVYRLARGQSNIGEAHNRISAKHTIDYRRSTHSHIGEAHN